MLKILKTFSKRQLNGKLKYFLEVECKCGKIFQTRKDGKAKSCGCLTRELNKTRRLGKSALNLITSKENLIRKTAEKCYKESKYNDSDISFDDFLILSQKECFYCGKEKQNKKHLGYTKAGNIRKTKRKNSKGEIYYSNSWGWYYPDAYFEYNGLDRIDQNKPHSKDNVVTCCKSCNFMKRNDNRETFLKKIEDIYLCQMKKKV